MSLARGDKEYILPVKGLNTEANLLHFPIEFASDMVNMEIDYNPQMVRPRKGLVESDLERLVDVRNASDHGVAITSFLWEGAGGNTGRDLIVVQVAESLYFFETDDLGNPTTAILGARYDLSDSLSGTTKGTLALLQQTRVVFSNIKGNLMVTCEQINPTVIGFLEIAGGTLVPTEIFLNIRDTLGVEDGIDIDAHPASLLDDHKYNLYNQGWYKQRRDTTGSATEIDPIAKYNTVNGEYPSNADVVWIGMVEEGGDLIFDAEWLKDQTFGSSPAGRGHYVVDAFKIDRAAILASPLTSNVRSGGSIGTGGGGTVAGGTFHIPKALP